MQKAYAMSNVQQDQTKTLEMLNTAVQETRRIWAERHGDFIANHVDQEAFSEVTALLGTVRTNLRNYVSQAFLSESLRSPGTANTENNERAWQESLRDTTYNRDIRPFFGHDRVPTSMDMAHLGIALLAESNLLNFTNVPIELPSRVEYRFDPIATAHWIVDEAPKIPGGERWAARIKPHLDFASEDTLRENMKFATFISAVRLFLESQTQLQEPPDDLSPHTRY